MYRSLFFFFLIMGCTYSFHGFFPKELKKAGVKTFENETNRFGLEVSVTQSFIDGLLNDGRLEVVEPDKASLLIQGNIKDYQREPHAYTSGGSVEEYKVTIRAEVSFIVTETDEEFIPKKVFAGWSTYNPSEKEEDDGIKEASLDLSSKVLKELFSQGW